MLQHLRKHLIRIYTIIAGSILTIVFVILAVFLNYQEMRVQYEQFTNHVYLVQDKLQNDTIISDAWLSNLEANKHLVIQIIDNGTPLFFPGAFSPKTPRSLLIQQVSKLAQKEGISLDLRPVSASYTKTQTYTIKGQHSDKYYGAAVVIAKERGYCSFYILQSIKTNTHELINQRIFLIILNILGIFGLFFLIRRLVDRSLQPVKENQKRQNQFIAAASHELRSPLAVIRVNNSLEKKDQEAYQNSQRIIEAECKRMSRLINDLLLLASGDANTWVLQKNEINVDTLLLNSYENSSAKAKEKNIRIQLDSSETSLPSIQGDYDRLLQVLTILLDNAICYSSSNSTIELSARLEKKTLSILVIDHGIGISEEDKKRIFDRFYRVDQSRKDKTHFGLGLSIAYELINLHHGSIKVIDTPLGGSTFVVTLPK